MNTYINNECTFVAQDSKVYEYNFDFRIVEFVINDGRLGGLVISEPTQTKSTYTLKQNYPYTYELPKDGRYSYYKLVVMSCNSIADTTNAIYVDCNSNLIYNNQELKDFTIIDGIIEGKAAGLLDSYSEEFFSICGLKHCLKKLQMEAFLEGIGSCSGTFGSNCNKKSKVKTNRDFLFVTYWLLNELICRGEFDKAEELLDRFNNTCGNICDQIADKDSAGCGCK